MRSRRKIIEEYFCSSMVPITEKDLESHCRNLYKIAADNTVVGDHNIYITADNKLIFSNSNRNTIIDVEIVKVYKIDELYYIYDDYTELTISLHSTGKTINELASLHIFLLTLSSINTSIRYRIEYMEGVLDRERVRELIDYNEGFRHIYIKECNDLLLEFGGRYPKLVKALEYIDKHYILFSYIEDSVVIRSIGPTK